eukprot:NODE_6811_length_605_cov_5.755396_g5824_i0.p3 GENE.NODE_6811_length_605_cov_5.755396_g5824_i0~~NODE_6811_length_605_cov_5.755396_g5824_i0.p3  ORF type:complete len:73 (+),score=9.08 NODE_6811_length_605_cov_5.755396_g5824_i0:224-442(+)
MAQLAAGCQTPADFCRGLTTCALGGHRVGLSESGLSDPCRNLQGSDDLCPGRAQSSTLRAQICRPLQKSAAA